jgi:hypothetical protein
MQTEIPQDQLERIQPLVDRFLTPFHELELAIPLAAESAADYVLQEETLGAELADPR